MACQSSSQSESDLESATLPSAALTCVPNPGCRVGFCSKGESLLPVEQAIKDTDRVNYFKGYLASLERAMKEDGVVCIGACLWSFSDNWEWAEGYGPRFGVTHVDYVTQKR